MTPAQVYDSFYGDSIVQNFNRFPKVQVGLTLFQIIKNGTFIKNLNRKFKKIPFWHIWEIRRHKGISYMIKNHDIFKYLGIVM